MSIMVSHSGLVVTRVDVLSFLEHATQGWVLVEVELHCIRDLCMYNALEKVSAYV